MQKVNRMDLTEGPIFGKIIKFTIPILLGNLLQQLYTATDRIVVGQFAQDGAGALAAIGSTASPINLLVGLFIGIATGCNVICANLLGARNHKDLRKSMHTSVLLAVYCGIGLLLFGVFCAPTILEWMDTPASVMAQAKLYMRLYFIGVPASLVYNISAGILRAHGDTKRPMYILILSGLVNVILNLVLVVFFHLDVAGVAIATTVSQFISAFSVVRILFSRRDQYRLSFRELAIDRQQLLSVIRIGLPSGLGTMVFSASNILIQSSVNSFGNAAIIAGKTAAHDINNLVYQVEGALLATCVSFSGQCYGAKKYKRIDRVALTSSLLCVGVMALAAIPCALLSDHMIRLFNQDPEVVQHGGRMLAIMSVGMILYAPAESFSGCSRGMRHAMAPTLLNILAICGCRLIWILFLFPQTPTVEFLFYCYPVSWTLSSIVQIGYFYYIRKKKIA